MLSEDDFQKAIEIGTEAEDKVYEYLKDRNSYVQDMRKQKHEAGIGPRLMGTEGDLVLPDFTVYNKKEEKGNFAVDVKFKSSVYPVNGKLCFTVDKKFEDYKRIVEIFKLNFLMIIFVYKDRFYSYKADECIGRTIFNNQHGSGFVYLFEFDESKITY